MIRLTTKSSTFALKKYPQYHKIDSYSSCAHPSTRYISMGNAEKIRDARVYGSQESDSVADRYLIIYQESGVAHGVSRGYKLDDNTRSTLITAQSFGQFFGKGVEITVCGADTNYSLELLPKRKLFNNGFNLIHQQSGKSIASIGRTKKGAWNLLDLDGQVLATTAHTQEKVDGFVYSLGEGGNPENKYALLANGKAIAHARKTNVYADPEAAAAEERSAVKPKGFMQRLFGSQATRKDTAIALAFTDDAGQHLEDHLLMPLMMVHHEWNIVRAND